MHRPFLWAHRGASCCAPENTLAAFEAAVADGADGIEMDIHLSRDGVPVVIHDETLDRTTDGCGPVAAASLAQLKRLDAGGWFAAAFAGEPVPTLETVLATFGGRVRLNLELKEFRAGLVVLELLGHYPEADIVVSSFDLELLCRLRAVDSRLPLAVLCDSGSWRRALVTARDLRACAFHLAVGQVCRPLVAACARAGLPVSVWTVDCPEQARSLVRTGVAGLFTNAPGLLDSALGLSHGSQSLLVSSGRLR